MPKVQQVTSVTKPTKPVISVPKTGFGALLKPAEVIDRTLKVALYGRNGSGKTTLWSTFPTPTLVLLSSGPNGTSELKSISAARRKEMMYVELTDPMQVEEACKFVRSNGTFKTVVVENITGVQDLVMCNILGIPKMPEQLSFGFTSRENWGQCTERTKEIMRMVCGLPTNVVMVAQEREFKQTEDGGLIASPYIGAALTPSSAGWLHSNFDFLFQTGIRQKVKRIENKIAGKVEVVEEVTDEPEFFLRIGPHPVFFSKIRAPIETARKIDPIIVDPTYDKIIAVVDGIIQGG